MIRYLLTGLALLVTGSIYGQVVNTEKLRTQHKEEGWFFDISANISLTQNKAGRNLSSNARLRTEYLKGKHKYLLFGSASLGQFQNVYDSTALPSNWLNNRFVHLRYNYTVGPRITMEAFTQLQYDQIQEIRMRFLNGVGPRVALISSDTASLYLGALYMFEYEETTDTQPLTYNRDHRLSTYVSGGFRIKNYLAFNHISYYQPSLSDVGDFRVSSESTISVKITQALSFDTYFQFIYDSRPPETVPSVMYSSRSGLTMSF